MSSLWAARWGLCLISKSANNGVCSYGVVGGEAEPFLDLSSQLPARDEDIFQQQAQPWSRAGK